MLDTYFTISLILVTSICVDSNLIFVINKTTYNIDTLIKDYIKIF